MKQIKTYRECRSVLVARLEHFQQRLSAAFKWWAEHQAWPATEEIRIERHRSTCG